MKALVASGETNQEEISKAGTKVLGIELQPCSDTIYINLSVSLKTLNKEKTLSSAETVKGMDKGLLTLRNLLSVVNGVYYPVGQAASITTRLCAAFCELSLHQSPIEWDSPFFLDLVKNCGWI